MRRRIVWATAVLAVLLVVPAVPASAAEFTIQQPDGDVTEPSPIEVVVERDFGAERLRQLRASLQKDGVTLGAPVDLECRRGCEEFSPEAALFVLPGNDLFDPGSGAPFGADGPLPNGAYTLKLDLLKNSNFQDDETFEGELHLAVPPSRPVDVSAELDGDGVALTWTKSPEPDVERYRVERRDGDDWEKVTTTSSASYVDDPGEGNHTYRVVAERPDGRGGTLEAASSERKVEVPAPEEDASRNGGGNGDTERGDEGGTDGNGGDGGTGDDGANGSDADAQQSDTSEQSDSSRRSRSGGAAAPSTGSGRSGSIPGIGERPSDGYATELDYGAMGDGEAADDVRVANPGGWRGTVDQMFDAERVAVPIAAGLVMTGMGLHLWRWLRVPLP